MTYNLVGLSFSRFRDWSAQPQSNQGPPDTDPGGDIEVSCTNIKRMRNCVCVCVRVCAHACVRGCAYVRVLVCMSVHV